LSGDEARRRFPYLAPEVVSARFRQGDGWLDVKKLTMGFAQAASANGATFCVNTPATGFEISGGKLKAVETARGAIACDFAVIARSEERRVGKECRSRLLEQCRTR